MKIETKEATVETNIAFGESLKMGMAQEGLIHIMSLLTNLYNDPELAVIREYYTNALDAHTAVGQTLPVEVYTPTRDNPLYVVKDLGIGMSADDVRNIYSQYGASTKRDSNEQVGAFGLGCKSALTIATQFTVKSVKNGVQTTALISKTDTGENAVQLLDPRDTDEPNGTTVTIGVPHVSSFNEKLMKFFKYGDPTKVRINGHHPDSVFTDAIKLDTKPELNAEIWVKEAHYYSTEYKIIMGNVPYDFTSEHIDSSLRRLGLDNFDVSRSGRNVYFRVGIGEVDLTPSREGLRYTDKTNAIIDAMLGEYIATIQKVAMDEINAVPTRDKVHEVARKWSNVLTKDKLLWKGEAIPSNVRFDGFTASGYLPTVWRSVDGGGSHSTSSYITLPTSATFVTGRPEKEYRRVAAYLTPYLNSIGSSSDTFYFVEDASKLTNKWIIDNPSMTIITADALVDIGKAQRKLDRAAAKASMGASTKFKYPVLDIATGVTKNVPYDHIPAGTPYMYSKDYVSGIAEHVQKFFNGNLDPDRGGNKTTRLIAQAFRTVTKHKQITLIGGTRSTDAYEKRVKGSYNVIKDIEKVIQDSFVNVHPTVKNIIALEDSTASTLFKVIKASGMEAKVLDRDLRRLMTPKKRAKIQAKKLTDSQQILRYIQPANKSITLPQSGVDVFSSIVAKYPLVSAVSIHSLSSLRTEHLVTYMNAVHTESLTAAP